MPPKRYVFHGVLFAEGIEHAMLTLAADLIESAASAQAEEMTGAGEVREVRIEVGIEPEDDA